MARIGRPGGQRVGRVVVAVENVLGVREIERGVIHFLVLADAGVGLPDADTFATGGTLVYLTLGGILPVNETFAPYANIQVPLYQNVHGIQLTPKYIVSVGARFAF